ncbi:hypothetical protein VTJ83DRAFT_6456 [Remersonia thermophila]|uniref:EKC/KEOPS complex subunit GON7 n=1 Tax=Remersonia thermophila TaxID=72144 RepID=A0ABR4D696_9PEZI
MEGKFVHSKVQANLNVSGSFCNTLDSRPTTPSPRYPLGDVYSAPSLSSPRWLSTRSHPQTKITMSSQPTLSATYASATNDPFAFSTPISISPAATGATALERKTAFLSTLRKSVSALQADINRELTARMEEDKAREAAQAGGGKGAGKGAVVDDEKEEENYGEEVVDEED